MEPTMLPCGAIGGAKEHVRWRRKGGRGCWNHDAVVARSRAGQSRWEAERQCPGEQRRSGCVTRCSDTVALSKKVAAQWLCHDATSGWVLCSGAALRRWRKEEERRGWMKEWRRLKAQKNEGVKKIVKAWRSKENSEGVNESEGKI